MSSDEDGVSLTRSMLMESLKTIRQFDWLIDSYVLDFFVDELWNKLPLSWQDYFSNFDLQSLCYFLDLNSANDGIEKVVPLSLSALRVLLNRNIIQREAINSINVEDPGKQYLHSHKRLKKIFEKHIKPKKLHEIDKFSSLCNEISKKTNTNHIVDVGAGLGHLSRVLSFSYGLKMCCIEQQPSLTQQARLIDRDLENRITKLKLPGTCVYAPMHKNLRISNDIDVNQFQTMAFDDAKGMGLIGLHPCGDLGPILMNYFIRGDTVKFLCIAGCCFMKLTTDKTNAFVGYPLGEFLLTKEDNLVVLSYEAREVSCHAVEMYCKRLIEGLYEELQIHCYRATLEEILVKYSNDFKHLGLKSVKHKNNLIFLDYCSKATNHLNIRFREEDLTSNRVTDCLKRWKQVVIFYSLRLMLAPLIESIILLDRKLYILENGYNCDILPVFDPQLSPRNHILVAYKP